MLLPYFGPGVSRVRVSRAGGTIVGLDAADSTLYLVRTADWRTSRVVAPGWKFDRLGAVSATALIVAHGRQGGGPFVAVLLRPASR